MSDCEERATYCHSIFQGACSETTAERYTAAWVRMINLLEKMKTVAADLPEEK